MGEQEHCKVGTRASRKRTYEEATSTTPNELQHELPHKNKRIALGELTNSQNITGSTQETNTQKPKLKSKKILVVTDSEIPKLDRNVSPNSDDSRKYSYAPLIYQHLHSLEVEEKRRPLPNYMQKIQKDVTPTMREILVDWLVEVAEEYKLVSDTLYLTVSYIDRFLSSHALERNQLQLLGVASMLVASKYEEISPPHVEDFCYITDNTYTREEVVNMEKDVLKFLNFEIGNPTPKTFLRIFTKAAQENTIFAKLDFEFLGSYLVELSLLDYNCVRFLPSMVAASAIFLSRFTLLPQVHPWNLKLQQYTGYTPSELIDCILGIHDIQLSKKLGSLKAIREKYSHHKFKCVGSMQPPSVIPLHYFSSVYENN